MKKIYLTILLGVGSASFFAQQTFTNFQSASLVIGQANFTTNSSTTNSVTTSTSSSDVTSYDKLSSGDVNALCPKTTTDSYTTGGGNFNTQHTDTKTCTLS